MSMIAWYYMDMEKQLSIDDIERILGYSRGTAYYFAKANGEMVGNKWFVPESVINAEIDSRAKEVQRMRATLAKIKKAGAVENAPARQ
jgi:hypothetical protein